MPKDPLFEWDTEAMDEEKILGDASQANDKIQSNWMEADGQTEVNHDGWQQGCCRS